MRFKRDNVDYEYVEGDNDGADIYLIVWVWILRLYAYILTGMVC